MPELPFSFTAQIRWGDIDRLGHVNHVRLAEYFQEARAAFLNASGHFTAVAVRVTSMEFTHPLHAGGTCAVVSVLVSKVGRTSLTVAQEIRNTSDAVCTTAETVLVALDPATGTARQLTEGERVYFDDYIAQSESRRWL